MRIGSEGGTEEGQKEAKMEKRKAKGGGVETKERKEGEMEDGMEREKWRLQEGEDRGNRRTFSLPLFHCELTLSMYINMSLKRRRLSSIQLP